MRAGGLILSFTPVENPVELGNPRPPLNSPEFSFFQSKSDARHWP
jgi:hypothetical protein